MEQTSHPEHASVGGQLRLMGSLRGGDLEEPFSITRKLGP